MVERPIDFVTKVGNIEIPFYTFTETPVKSRDVMVRYKYDPSKFTEVLYGDRKEVASVVPKDVADFRHYIVSRKLEEINKSDKPKIMTNGPIYGLFGMDTDNESENPNVTLYEKPVRFFDHVGIAQSLDIPHEIFGGSTLREFYNIDPCNLQSFLPNAVGCNVSLRSSDGYLIWMNRGDRNIQYPNRKGVPAGFGNTLKDVECGVVHPRMTAAREVGEEAGVPVDTDKLTLLHVGRPYDDLHSEISWMYNVDDMKADEILKAPKRDGKYEGRLFKIPFDLKDETIKHLRNPSEWVLSHWYVTLQHLASEFGMDKIGQKINS